MKKLIAIASIAALAACAQPAEQAPAPAETTATAAAPAEMTAADMAGTYDAKYPDGTTHVVVINADGTFSDTDPAGVATTGTFALKDGKTCFDPEGDAPEACWTDGEPDAAGVFTATAPDGTVVTVTPRAAPEAAATPAPAAT